MRPVVTRYGRLVHGAVAVWALRPGGELGEWYHARVRCARVPAWRRFRTAPATLFGPGPVTCRRCLVAEGQVDEWARYTATPAPPPGPRRRRIRDIPRKRAR